MNADPELRERLDRATAHLRIDADRQLEQIYQWVPRRRRVRRVATVAAAAVLGVASVVIAWRFLPLGEPEIPGTAGPTGRIAYLRWSGDSTDLLVLDAASGEVRVLDAGAESPTAAQWSPDGSRIAYISLGPDRSAIIVARADGSDPVTILDQEEVPGALGPDLISISWSPEASRIAYSGRVVGRGRTVLVMNADGTGEPAVVDGHWEGVSWSPDGERLLLVGFPDTDASAQQFDLYTVHPDGTGLRRLTDDELIERTPSWSPDGARIVFSRNGGEFERPEWDQDVYVMEADGSNVRRLTDWDGLDFAPAWSPDGAWIAFASDRDATAEQQRVNREGGARFTGLSVYVMRADGSDVRRLLEGGDESLYPLSWMLGELAPPEPTATETAAAEWSAPPVGEALAGFTEDGMPLIVVHHAEGGFTAVEAVSPHRPWGIKKLLGWCPSSRTFDDPFHGARFDEYGRYISGPAPTGLVLRTVDFVPGSELPVKVGGPLPALPREERGLAPRGPLCLGATLEETGLIMPAAAGDLTPSELVAFGPPPGARWSVQGVLYVRRDGSVRLCASVEAGGRCRAGAPVLGIDGASLLQSGQDGDSVRLGGEWLVAVEAGALDVIWAAGEAESPA
jgi:TolB protein